MENGIGKEVCGRGGGVSGRDGAAFEDAGVDGPGVEMGERKSSGSSLTVSVLVARSSRICSSSNSNKASECSCSSLRLESTSDEPREARERDIWYARAPGEA